MAVERGHVELEHHIVFVQAHGVLGDILEIATGLDVLVELMGE